MILMKKMQKIDRGSDEKIMKMRAEYDDNVRQKKESHAEYMELKMLRG